MLFKLIKLCEVMGAINTTVGDITGRPHAPSGVAAFMSAPRPQWGRSIHVSPQ